MEWGNRSASCGGDRSGNWLIVAKTSGGSSLMAEAIRSVATEEANVGRHGYLVES